MKSFNKVILIGNVVTEVSLNTLKSGSKAADFRLAVKERFKDKEGNQKDQATFVTIETWGRRAETCYKHLAKGRSVLIEGRLKMNEWENDQGEKRSRLLITAEKVEFLDYPEKSEEK